MALKTAFLLIGVSVLVLGAAAANFAVLGFWNRIRHAYASWQAKVCIAGARALSAIATFQSHITPPNSPDAEIIGWISLAAGFAWAAWEVFQALGDAGLAANTAILKSELATSNNLNTKYQRQINIFTAIMVMLRTLTHTKRQRISKLSEKPTVQDVAHALDPQRQINETLSGLTNVLQSLHASPSSEAALTSNFRVGLYVPSADKQFMEPFSGFSAQDGSYSPFSSYMTNRDRFELTNRTNPAHTVKCVQQKRTFIIPNAERECAEFYNGDTARQCLRSLVAYPINEILHQSGSKVTGAIVIDSDQPDYFSELDRTIIEMMLAEFAARLTLEMQLLKIVPKSKKGKNHEPANG